MDHAKEIWPGSTQLAPLPVVLAGCGSEGGYNLITIAWAGIVCSAPPMVSIAVRPERHSFGLIKQSGEFSINVPTAAMAKKVDWCGVKSGREFNKFKECNWTAVAGSKVKAPIVAECPLALECKVVQTLDLGAHTLFIAEIVAVQVSKDHLDEKGRFLVEKDNLLCYVHGHYYGLGECLGHFGYSVKKKEGPKIRK